MNQHIEAFLEMMSAERAASKHTLDAYARDLGNSEGGFEESLIKQKTDLLSAEIIHIQHYLQILVKAGRSPRTSARKLSAIKQFYLFLVTENLRSENPTALIESPQIGRSLPKYLDEAEVDRLLSTAHMDTTEKGIRLAALLELLYATGLRISELITLKMGHLRKEAGPPPSLKPFLMVMGKGNKERLVPLNPSAIKALLAYLDVRDSFIKIG